MLSNAKYIVDWRWGKTTTIRNSAGKKKQVPVPVEDRVFADRPDLGIIDRETWDKTQLRLKELEDIYGQKDGQQYARAARAGRGACWTSRGRAAVGDAWRTPNQAWPLAPIRRIDRINDSGAAALAQDRAVRAAAALLKASTGRISATDLALRGSLAAASLARTGRCHPQAKTRASFAQKRTAQRAARENI